jgi:hypothetical protein
MICKKYIFIVYMPYQLHIYTQNEEYYVVLSHI